MKRKSTFQWAEKYFADNPDIAAAIAQPMIKPILDCIDDNRAARFFILMIPQFGKSLCGQLRFMRSKQVEPRASLWYRESKDQLTGFASEKFNPLFDSCPRLREICFEDRNKRKTLAASYSDGTSVALLSAGTKGNRQSRTACDIYLDEPWLYEPGWVGEIQKRRSAPAYAHDYREIYMSTGPTADSEADQCWMSSTQELWHVGCPACGELFFPSRTHKHEKSSDRIGGLIYETTLKPNGLPDERAIAASVYYKCPKCSAVLPNDDATRAEWNRRGRYIATNPNAAPNTFGWRVNAVAVKNWGEVALKMVKAQLAKERAGDLSVMEELIRMFDADRWEPEKFMKAESFSRYQHPTPYKMRSEWAGEIKDEQGNPLRIATVDVQLDYFVLVIRKWGRFSESRLHFCALCLSPSEIALHLKNENVSEVRVAFDVRHDTQKTRTICSRMGWRTMMGDKAMRDYSHPDGMRRIFDAPKWIDAFTGSVHQGQASGGFVVETIFSKNSALNRLATLRDADSKAPDGSPLWTAAEDAPEWYFKQINAHYRKRVENGDGSHHSVWMGQKEDHADDCEAMGVVIASALGLTGAESMDPS